MKTFTWIQLAMLNAYWFALGFTNSSMTPLIGPVLVNQFVSDAEKNTYYAQMRVLGLFMAMAVQPIFGLLSDRCGLRFGRRRPFIIGGMALNLVFLIAIGAATGYWWLVAAMLLFQFSSNIAQGGLQGLIPDVVPEDQSGRASGVKAVLELAPVFLVSFTIGPLLAQGNMTASLIILGVVFIVTALLTSFSVKEPPLAAPVTTPFWTPIMQAIGLALVFLGLEFGAEYLVKTVVYSVTDTSSLPFITALSAGVGQLTAILIGVWIGAYIGLGKEIRQSHSFVWWIVNRLLFFTAVVGIYSFLLYFVKDMFNLTTNEAAGVSSILSADVGAFLIVAALLSGIISDRIGRKGLLMLAGVLAAAALLLMVMLPSYVMLFISGALLGVAVGIFNTVNWALGTDLVPSDQAARYLGISNLAGAGAGMIASGIGGSLIDYVNLKLPGSTAGYLAIFASFAALCVVSSVVLLAIHEPAHQTVMKKVAV